MLTIHANYNTCLTESNHNLCNGCNATYSTSKQLALTVINNHMNSCQR